MFRKKIGWSLFNGSGNLLLNFFNVVQKMFWIFFIFMVLWAFIIGFKIFFRIVIYFISRKLKNSQNDNRNFRTFYYTSRPKYRRDSYQRQHTIDDEKVSSVRENRQAQIIDAEYQDLNKDK